MKIKTEFVDEDFGLEIRLHTIRSQESYLRSIGITEENVKDFHIERIRSGMTETIRVFPKKS